MFWDGKEYEMVNPEKNRSPQDRVDQCLQQRVAEVQSHPPQSPERQRSLNYLVNEILAAGTLGHPQQGLWSAGLYDELYREALQKTLIEICQKVDAYNPEHPVMAWVNFKLNYQFIEVVNDYNRKGITHLPRASSGAPVVFLPSLADLDQLSAEPEQPSPIQQLQDFLEQDPEQRLQRRRLRDRSDITFQRLAIAKFIDGKSWSELAIALDVSAQTLCSFFNRQLKDLIPYFQKHLEP